MLAPNSFKISSGLSRQDGTHLRPSFFVGTAGSVFKTIINAEEADAEIAKVEDRIQKLQRTIADASDVGLLTTMMVGGDAVDVDRLVEDLARLEAELTKLQATRKKFADDAAAESPEAILAGQWGDSFRAASAATEEFDKSIADWAQKIALSADPARVLEENMIKLEIALENGAISADEYAKAVAYLTPKIKKAKGSGGRAGKRARSNRGHDEQVIRSGLLVRAANDRDQSRI